MSRCERCGDKDHTTSGHDAAMNAALFSSPVVVTRRVYCKDPELAKRIRRLQAKAWDQGFDEGLKRPRTPSEAWKAPPTPRNPYKGRAKK